MNQKLFKGTNLLKLVLFLFSAIWSVNTNGQCINPSDTAICFGDSITLCAGNTTTNSTYIWSTGDTTACVSVNPSSTTTYSVTVQDSSLICIDSVTVTVSPEINISATVNNNSSQNACNGQIFPSVTGGVFPYTFVWDTAGNVFATTQSIFNLCENIYCLTVADFNNCTVDTCVNVEWNSCNLNLSSDSILCNGDPTNIQVFVDTTAGIGSFLYLPAPRFVYSIYSLNPTTLIQSQPFGLSLFTFNNPLIIAGDYLVTVYDNSWQDSCSSTISISEPDPILIYTTINNTSATWNNDGSILIDSVIGGVGGFSITWYDSSYTQSPPGTAILFDSLLLDFIYFSHDYYGGYSITIIDANGCTGDTTLYVYTDSTIASFETVYVSQHETCFGFEDGKIFASMSDSAIPPFIFYWMDQATGDTIRTDCMGCPPPSNYNPSHVATHTNLSPGGYSLSVTDALGNQGDFIDQIEILAADSIHVQLGPDFVIPCGEDTVLSIDLLGGGSSLNDTLLISTETLNFNNAPIGFSENLIAGKDYLMVVSGTYTELATGNTFDAAYQFLPAPTISTVPMHWVMDGNTTHRPTPDVYQATHSYNFPFVGNLAHTFSILNPGFTGNLTFQLYEITLDTTIYTYSWTTSPPSSPVAVISSADTAWAYPGVSGTDYILTVEDANGCEAKDTVNVSWDLYILNFDSIGVSNTICNGGATGSIIVTPDSTTGFTPYTIFMDGFATTTPTPFLSAGSYTINIEDAVGCLSHDSVVIVTQPDSLYACGIDTLMVPVLVDAFTMTFDTTYSYTTVLTQFGLEYKLVISGTYRDEWNNIPPVDTKDAAYQFNDSVNANPLSPPLAINEWGWNGTFTARPTPDVYDPTTHTYEYYFVGDSTNQVFTYTDPTADYLNNDGSLSFELYKMLCSTTDTVYTCFGDSTATATVYPNGGVPFINNVGTSYYNVVWTDNLGSVWGTNAIVSGLPAGNFTATITDSLGCTFERGLVVLQPAAPLQVNLLAQDNVRCKGDSTGTIYAVVLGGFTSNYVILTQGNDTIYSLGGQLDTIQITGLPAGIYQFYAFETLPTGINICGQNMQITITEPDTSLYSTINLLSNVKCWGDSTAKAYVTAEGGADPWTYTYQWHNAPFGINGDGETTDTAYYLWADITINSFPNTLWHNVTVTDPNGCTVEDSVEIKHINKKIRPFHVDLIGDTIWEIKFIEDSVSCFNLCDGMVSLETFGGVLPHAYVWDVDPNTIVLNQPDTVDGLCEGGHDVLITDYVGCKQRIRFRINEPDQLYAIGSEVSPISCFGFNDGTAHALGVGGNNLSNQQSSYTFNWFVDSLTYSISDSLLGVGQNIDSLPPGIHIVQVTDYKGCVATDTVEIIEPTQLSVIIVDTSTVYAYCEFTESAKLCAQAIGGTPGYVYQWDDAYFQNNFTSALFENSQFCAVNLTPVNINSVDGSYNVIVIDDRGCVASETIDIDTITNTFNSNSFAYTVLDVKCFDGFDGSISIDSLVMIDSITNGILDTIFSIVTLPDPAYNIVWTGPNGFSQTGANIISLYAGSYAVIITDGMGCERTNNISLTEPDKLEYGIYNWIHETCTGDGSTSNSNGSCDGQIMVNITGGTGNYYWDKNELNVWPILPVNQEILINDTLIDSLCSGLHEIYITDDNGCDAQVIAGGIGAKIINTLVTVNLPSGIVPTIDAMCPNSNDGQAWIQPWLVNPLFNYSWIVPPYLVPPAVNTIVDVGVSTSILAIGPYELVAHYTDAANFGINYLGCDATNPFQMSGPSAIMPNSIINSVSCWGDSTGSISLNTSSGGTGAHTYDWDTTVSLPNGSISSTVSNLLYGTYTVTITDANGCDTTLAILVTQPSQIQNDFTINDVLCYGDPTGSITPITSGGTPTGGNPSYTYSWGGINPLAVTSGTYSITITDANGCSIIDEAIVNEPNPLTLSLNPNNDYGLSPAGFPYFISCDGASDGEVLATASGGSLPYTYAWDDPIGQTSNPAISLSAGSINCILTDGNNCTIIESVLLIEPSIIIDNATLSTNSYGYEVSCFGASDGWISLNPTGGVPESNGSYSYNWSNSSLDSVSSGVSAGNYSVSIVDANGCSYSFNYTLISPSEVFNASVSTLNYAGPSHPPVNVTFSDATTDNLGNPILVNHYWYWTNDGATDSTTNSGFTTFEHVFTEVGSNNAYVLVQNANSGCIDTVNFIIDVQGIDYTTNVFSPNGDGINDEFVFDEFGIKVISVEIYNRWGSLVTNWTDLDKGWDGRGSDGQDLPDGVYFYVLTAEGEDGHYYENKGSITLLR